MHLYDDIADASSSRHLVYNYFYLYSSLLSSHRVGKHGDVSSDDSDGGRTGAGGEVFTCDEGREADDEQSDWVTDGPGPVYGVPSLHCNTVSKGSIFFTYILAYFLHY